MAKIKQEIRAAGPVISKQEMNQIVKAAGGNTQTAINRIASVQSNMKEAGKTAPSVASGAANMLIKQAQATPTVVGTTPFGTSKLGQTLQSMVGTPSYTAPRNPQSGGSYGGSQPGTPTNLMIGGTMIRPGGSVAINPMAFAGGTGSTSGTGGAGPYNAKNMPLNTGTNDVGPLAPGTTGGDMIGGDQFDYQSILDAIAGIQQPQFDMSALTDMFNTQFDQLRSEFATRDPIQLAQLGRAYGGDAIRARQRNRRSSRDYRRGMANSAFGPATANLAIGGGLTL